jgi:hypothetical protein
MRTDALLRGLPLGLASLVALVAAQAASAAPATPPPAASAAVYAENLVQPSRLKVKPRGHYSHVSVQDLQWTGWGQPSTSAHGTLIFQFCFYESCSVSPFYAEPVTVSLSRLQSCRARLSYTLLALNVEGPLPEESFKTYRTSLAGCPAPSSHARAKKRPKRHP